VWSVVRKRRHLLFSLIRDLLVLCTQITNCLFSNVVGDNIPSVLMKQVFRRIKKVEFGPPADTS
jgi:hypothetical protein